MRFKLTLILITLNLLAGYYIYTLEKRSELSNEFEQASTKVFADVFDIDHLVIEAQTAQATSKYVLNRKRRHWHISEPIDWPANDNAVERIIEQLQSLEKEISFSLEDLEKGQQSLADYGLDNPSIRLTFSSPKSAPQTLNIGAPTEMGSRIYVMHTFGQEVILIGDTLLRSLSISLNELRSQQIFSLPLFAIDSLVLQSGEQRTRIEKDKEHWQFVTPVSAPANSSLVDHTLNELVNAHAILLLNTKENDLEKLGLTTPSMRIILRGNNRRQTLSLGNVVDFENKQVESPPMRYALLEDSPTVFTVIAEPFDKLKQAQAFLREKQFFQFDPKLVRDITIAQSNREVKLQKLEDQNEAAATPAWQVMSKGDNGNIVSIPADARIVAQLLGRLSQLEAMQFVSDAPAPGDLTSYGFDNPNGTISIQLENGETQTLLLGNTAVPSASDAAITTVFAKRKNAPSIYQVRSQTLALANTDPLYYRKRVLEKHPNSAQVQALTLTQVGSAEPLFARSIDLKSTTWPLALEDMAADQAKAVVSLIDSICTEFRVNNYVTNEFTELPNLPWAYKLVVEISLPGGQEAQTIRRTYFFTKRLEGNRQIGGSVELGFVFTLTQELIDALYPLTSTASLPELPDTPEAVEKAELPIPQP